MLNSAPVLVPVIGLAFIVGVDVLAFFHPFADGGGGGERVLWVAVQALQVNRPDVKLAIYCRAGRTPNRLCEHAEARFNLKVQPTFETAHLLAPERYPRFTMLGQAWGSVRVALEGLRQLLPGIYVDTTGWAFPYPLVWLAGARVAAYVHYPTISTDMLERVRERHNTYNNDSGVSQSWVKSAVKLAYYHLFALLYGAVGAFASVVMVNSSWTRRHISELWWRWGEPQRVYPPCDTEALLELPLDRRLKRVYLVSVAQFRPEKDHALQLRAFALAREKAGKVHTRAGEAMLSAQLKLAGSCRNAADERLLHSLQGLAKELGLEDHVEFCVNVPFSELLRLLGDAVAGLHTMVDEHFGISVVEYMAAGVVPIANDSAGPKEDIVLSEMGSSGGGEDEGAEGQGMLGRDGSAGERDSGRQQQIITGYRCRTVEEYADAILDVVGMEQLQRMRIAAAARRRAQMFSDRRFQAEFMDCMLRLLPPRPKDARRPARS
ncbi:hypothetical protein N2152v2_009198 [Parachlorella kessleri]